MADQFWLQLTGRCLMVAQLLVLSCADNGQTLSTLVRTKRQTTQDECIANCLQNCRTYTYDCWYGLCRGCEWMCPYTCRVSGLIRGPWRGRANQGTATTRSQRPPPPPQVRAAQPAQNAPTGVRRKGKKSRQRVRKGKRARKTRKGRRKG